MSAVTGIVMLPVPSNAVAVPVAAVPRAIDFAAASFVADVAIPLRTASPLNPNWYSVGYTVPVAPNLTTVGADAPPNSI